MSSGMCIPKRSLPNQDLRETGNPSWLPILSGYKDLHAESTSINSLKARSRTLLSQFPSLGGTHCLWPAASVWGATWREGVEKSALLLVRGLQAFLSDSQGPWKPGAGQGGRREGDSTE